jgi:hypothetical protein
MKRSRQLNVQREAKRDSRGRLTIFILLALLLTACEVSDPVPREVWEKATELCAPNGGIKRVAFLHNSLRAQSVGRIEATCENGVYIELRFNGNKS